jgi:hypothetical protein
MNRLFPVVFVTDIRLQRVYIGPAPLIVSSIDVTFHSCPNSGLTAGIISLATTGPDSVPTAAEHIIMELQSMA